MNPLSEPPERVLTEAGQWTEPWGDSCDGAACDKCGGAGRLRHECWSCLLSGVNDACPACAGAVRWQADCPVCRGSGRVDGEPRRGVSAFATVEGLYHYMIAKDADLERCLVLELEAELADDVDFDADQGAMLVLPNRVIDCQPVDRALADRVRRGAGQHSMLM